MQISAAVQNTETARAARVENAIQVNQVCRTLSSGGHDLHVLNNISFTVARGEWLALTGPSGSGKSTLLGILAGIDQPTSGQVRLGEVEISGLPESKLARIRNEKIGIVFQSFNLIPTMTALENVEAPLYINPRRREARAWACHMLNQVGLSERLHHLPHQLSGGEQQRVAIARALVTGPGLLLADEPTGNLDSATSKQVMALIYQLRKQFGLTVVMVTHDPQIAAYADRVMHIIDGQITEQTMSAAGRALAPRNDEAGAAGRTLPPRNDEAGAAGRTLPPRNDEAGAAGRVPAPLNGGNHPPAPRNGATNNEATQRETQL